MSDAEDDWLQKYAKGLGRVTELKQKMKDRGLDRAKAHCPLCEGKNTLQLRLVPSKRFGGALRWGCTACSFSGME